MIGADVAVVWDVIPRGLMDIDTGISREVTAFQTLCIIYYNALCM